MPIKRDAALIEIEKRVRRSIRDALNRTSRKPFQWGGLAGYAQLTAIAQTLHELPLEPETAYLRHLLPSVERALEKTQLLAQDVREAHMWLRRIANCLHYPADITLSADRVLNSEQIRREMDVLLAQFQPDRRQAPAQTALQGAWQQLWTTWSGDLLACYDIPGLPADNLRLETFFNRVRMDARRISGRTSTRSLGSVGQYAILFVAESEQDLLVQLRQVPVAEYQAHRQRLKQLEATRQHLYRLHHNPKQAMQHLLDQHAARRAALTAIRSQSPP